MARSHSAMDNSINGVPAEPCVDGATIREIKLGVTRSKDFMTSCEVLSQVAPDESAPAGDENPHRALIPLVRANVVVGNAARP